MQTDMKTPLLPSSDPDPSEPSGPRAPVISIMGSGDFSRSLSTRLVACGFRVVVGSREPRRVARGLFPAGVELLTQREAAERAEKVVFTAVYPEHYHTLVGLRGPLEGKVLVDVSNATGLNRGGQANAERLAELFPQSRVVKGFNTVSAWALQAGAHDGSRQVRRSWRAEHNISCFTVSSTPGNTLCSFRKVDLWYTNNAIRSGNVPLILLQVLICSDCSDSRSSVLQLARRLGFSPVDLGGLCASRDIEEAPLILFPSWGGPILTTFLLFLFFYGYLFLRNILLPYLDEGRNNFYELPLVTVNQTLPAVSLVTLALVYLPGNREPYYLHII